MIALGQAVSVASAQTQTLSMIRNHTQPALQCAIHTARPNYRVALNGIPTAAAIYSLGHGWRTSTAVPTSTQPSTLRGTIR